MIEMVISTTQSAVQATPLTAPMLAQSNPLITFFLGLGIGGFVLKVVEMMLGKGIEEWLGKRKISQQERRDLADQIIKICTEGSIGAWRKRPRDEEHVNYIANQVEGINKNLADMLRRYLGIWVLHFLRKEHLESVNANKLDAQYQNEVQYLGELERDAKMLEDRILVSAHKLKK